MMTTQADNVRLLEPLAGLGLELFTRCAELAADRFANWLDMVWTISDIFRNYFLMVSIRNGQISSFQQCQELLYGGIPFSK